MRRYGFLALLIFGLPCCAWGATTAKSVAPATVLESFLGIAYRNDGVINDTGQFATFNAPDVVLAGPGLNCSGFVLAASRAVLRAPIPVAAAQRDRLHDSGPTSPHGHDWDFGFDLIMNIGEQFPHALLLSPDHTASRSVSGPPSEQATGKTAPSFDPHGPEIEALLPRIGTDALYLVSFSKHTTPDAPPRLHYHTALIAREGSAVWLYSTTRASGKVVRMDLASPGGLARFRKSFQNTRGSHKRLTIIEAFPAKSAQFSK